MGLFENRNCLIFNSLTDKMANNIPISEYLNHLLKTRYYDFEFESVDKLKLSVKVYKKNYLSIPVIQTVTNKATEEVTTLRLLVIIHPKTGLIHQVIKD
jgi:hypothetical protein